MPERWLLARQNRTLIFIDLKIFEPMSVIADTLFYVGILCIYVLMRLMFSMLLCMSSFDDVLCICDAMDCMLGVFDLIKQKIRVFDSGRLLGIRVGNLNELSKR